MKQRQIEYYLQRTSNSKYDLYETVTKLPKILFSKIIDWTIFVVGFIFVARLATSFDYSWTAFIILFGALFLVGYQLIKIIFRGVSVGQLLMGIRYISIRSKEPITSIEYAKYLIENINAPVKYKELLSYYFSYNNRLLQNEPMKQYGFIIVDRLKYKAFMKEYRYNLSRLHELQQTI